ncbi:MAG: MGMT family protein [Syntrophales bacterium]|nr:MGMT family protein [Syntrophales bacterium]MDY0043414.1 MGMT family protein [Syntrophales bacterium]
MMIKNSNNRKNCTSVFYRKIPSPVFGELIFFWTRKDDNPRIIEIMLPEKEYCMEKMKTAYPDLREDTCSYFDFYENDLRLFLNGQEAAFLTEFLDWERCYTFQKRVLQKAFEIPRGKVTSYGRLAEKIGAPRAARAVGSALAKNPFPIVLPCHRVVRSNGHLGNFGGGIHQKRTFLLMEGINIGKENTIDPRSFW